MSSKEKNYNVFFIVAIIVSVTIILGTVTYAFYQSSINGNVSGTIARWSFTANDQTSSLKLDLGKLYPGKTETYNITLSAADSDLDVYYELVFGYSGLSYLLYFDSAYTKRLLNMGDSYVGKYGVITKGSSITIPLYLNWPYENSWGNAIFNDTLEIQIIAKQYTGYNGSIPMNLTGLELEPHPTIGGCSDPGFPGYYNDDCVGTSRNFMGYKFETINSTSGYMVAKWNS